MRHQLISRLLRCAILALAIGIVSSCGGGAFFRDDGTRIAHDAKTGEYIGERISERKGWDKEAGTELVLYTIRRKDGTVVELSADKVRLTKP